MDATASTAQVAIVGIGIRCAVGLSAAAAAAAVRAGVSRLLEHPYLIDRTGEPMVVAREPTLDPAEQSAERFASLAGPALQAALAPLASIGARPQRVHTFIGLPEPRPGLPPHIERSLARVVSGTGLASGVGASMVLLPNGNAAGIMALARAREQLRAESTIFCLAGGVDSYLTADTLEWMDERRILKTSANRNGFLPGEAAGFCLLTTGATARRLGMPVLGWLGPVATAKEDNRIRTESICVGRGLSDAILRATESLRRPEERIDQMICDLNGEPYRSEEFAFTVLRTQLSFVDFSRFITPADCWGDVGAASGPLFAGLALAAGLRGYSRGPRTMLWASSEGGDRAAAIVERADFRRAG